MSEIELILTKLKIVSEEKENGMYLCDRKHSKILLDYIQQKENIIKEVREYIENNKEYTTIEKATERWQNGKVIFEESDEDILNEDMIKELLKILDKEGDSNE